MKILPVGAELVYADGRTDGQTERRMERHAKLIVALRNFVNASKKSGVIEFYIYKQCWKCNPPDACFKTRQ